MLSGHSRDHVVGVASRFFSSNTYGATTVRGIASAADVTPSAIYYRFHDKVGLLAAVAEPLLSDLEALLTDTSTSVRSIDRVEVMRGYLLAILLHREAAQILLFDPSAGGTAPAERLADQQRRMVALLVGPRGTIDRQVRTRCAVAIAQLGAGELKGVPGHRLRKPLWEAAIDVLLGADEPRIHVSEGGDATLDVRSPRSPARDPRWQCAEAGALRASVPTGRGSVPTLVVDASGAVLHASSRARTLLGARTADLLGQSLVQLTVRSDRADLIAWLGGGSSSSEIVFDLERWPRTLGVVTGTASRVLARSGDDVLVSLVELQEPETSNDEGLGLGHEGAELAVPAHRNDELSEFAMRLAHDVRSSLMVMMAATQGLVRVAGADLSEAAQSLLGQMLQGIHHTSETIDASLRCSSAGTGLRFGAVDGRELVSAALEDLRPAAEKVGATVEAEGLGTGAVIADREQLALVFSNLLENAIVHGHDVRPPRISITSDDGPVMRTFAVADNGRGIEAGQRDACSACSSVSTAPGRGGGSG